MTSAPHAHQPAKPLMVAAALASGPADVLGFVLPLWAGAALRMSSGEIGILVATGAAFSLVSRPFTGTIADRLDRARTAAVGALILALSFGVYAVSHGPVTAFVAAALDGIGSATFWVALRARVGERIATEPGIFSRMLSAEVIGSWVAFAVALNLIGNRGYRPAFVLGALTFLAAAVLLARSSPHRPTAVADTRPHLGQLARRMRPLLLVIGVTATAEYGVGLLLLLHLQRHFGLNVGQIALVYLPGFIVFTIMPNRVEPLVRRLGNGRVLAISLISTAVVAVGLSFAAQPVVVAVLWALSAACLAAAIPVEQAVVARASDGSLGRGMGLYQSATLVGGVLGPIFGGGLYLVGWREACLGAAVVLLAGAAALPWALRRIGRSPEPETEPVPTPE